MKNIFLIFISVILYQSCQPQTDISSKNTCKAIHKYAGGRFLLLDSCVNKVDTILSDARGSVDAVVDVKIYKDRCLLIYRNEGIIALNSFEKRDGRWTSVVGTLLLAVDNNTGPYDIKIIDENHIRVKEVKTKKVKTYEINYAEKKVSFTESIDN